MGSLTGFDNSSNCVGDYAGIERIKMIPYESISARVADSTDSLAYQSFTLEAGEYWVEYDYDLQSAVHTSTKTEGRNKNYTHELVFGFGERSAAARNSIMEFFDCGCGATVAYEDANGTIWILEGKNKGLFLTANEETSGEADGVATDVITLSAVNDRKAKVYTGTWASLAIS